MIDHLILYFCFMIPAPSRSSSPVVSLPCTAVTLLGFFLLMLTGLSTWAQDSARLNPPVDSARSFLQPVKAPFLDDNLAIPYNRRRVKQAIVANGIAYGGLSVALYAAWYSQYPRSGFHLLNDIKEWQQVDKIGHVYSAYTAGKVCMEIWRWTGIDRKKRIWIGGLSGVAYEMIIETMDGFSAEWGWSWGDVGANVLGSALLIGQELAWDEQKIQMKFSAHRRSYNDPSLNARSNELFGSSLPERILKDYNGQTYWLSTGLRNLFPRSKLPAWLQLSVGTGADGMFGAHDNVKIDDNNQVVFDRRDIKRYRQWYLAPDIDLSKIKTRKKGVKMMLRLLNSIKIPAPGLSYGNGKLRWHWLLF